MAAHTRTQTHTRIATVTPTGNDLRVVGDVFAREVICKRWIKSQANLRHSDQQMSLRIIYVVCEEGGSQREESSPGAPACSR